MCGEFVQESCSGLLENQGLVSEEVKIEKKGCRRKRFKTENGGHCVVKIHEDMPKVVTHPTLLCVKKDGLIPFEYETSYQF